MDFITCPVCSNTSSFIFEIDIEHEGSVVDGEIIIDHDAVTTDRIIGQKSWNIEPNTSRYEVNPKPVMVAGKPVRCVRCGHPVWHQQDIITYHRMANCSGCELCMLEARESLIDICARCREKNSFPECSKCIHGESREYHGLDLI